MTNRPVLACKRGFASVLLLLLLVCIPPSMARDIPVASWDVSIPYGEWTRGDVFTDTLRFIGDDGEQLVALEADPTCDCLTADVLIDGQVVIRFEVLSDELDGPTEKLMYVFTESSVLDLLRVRLSLDVLPDAGQSESEDGQSDSDLSGYLSDGYTSSVDGTI
ncbi:MAG TPA: hypothetical protein ENH10_00445, partial [Bacteroidetes bacterium]|nr:hypothetical protein [Bacteroidota bacterium]HEX03614.1 hypothetical protein [Bacteroidota bacterium]